MAVAKFVLSLDCELLWGSHYIGGEERFSYLRQGFEGFYEKLLASLEKVRIRGTFAFVAAMVMEPDSFLALANAAPNEFYRDRLFQLHAKASRKPKSWFNPDIVRRVASAPMGHEIGSHSLTHIRFTDPEVTSEIALFELNQSCDILSDFLGGRSVSSFVFPESKIGHLEALAKSKIRLYRDRNRYWYANLPYQRGWHFLDQLLAIQPRVVDLSRDGAGNSCVGGSMTILGYDGIRSAIPDSARFLKIKKGIDAAIAARQVFHLWFHPWNLGSSGRMGELLDAVLEYVRLKESEGLISVNTMNELTA